MMSLLYLFIQARMVVATMMVATFFEDYNFECTVLQLLVTAFWKLLKVIAFNGFKTLFFDSACFKMVAK